jgi:hypothetical protein
MAVLSFKAEARVKFGAAFVIFPDLVEPWFPGLIGEFQLPMNIPFSVTNQFQKPWFLGPIPAIRENHQYFAFCLFCLFQSKDRYEKSLHRASILLFKFH